MDIQELVRKLSTLIPDPRQGLPEDVFLLISRLTPLVNVDLLIQDEHKGTLLTWRDDVFSRPGWHVPGGIIRFKETAATRIRAVARNELRTDVTHDPDPVAIIEGINPVHNTRGHFISFLYRCRLTSPLDENRRFQPGQPFPDFWEWHKTYPADMLPMQEIYRPYF